MSAKKDLTGQRFGRLTVICDSGKRKRSFVVWRCVCDCGNIAEVKTDSLKSGNTKSCGCLHDERAIEKCKKMNDSSNKYKTHGMTGTRIFRIYCGMKNRCYNKTNKDYKHYGSRGIKVCDEWLADFMAFYNWAIANGYSDELTIDRKDVNGNYAPDNCKWSTRAEQARNQRRTKNREKSVG